LGRIRIDIETCERSAGQVKIIVETSNRCIEDPAVIEKILAHLKGKAPSVGTALLPENRGPPQARLGVPASSTESRMLSSLLLLLFWRRRAFFWLDAENWADIGEKQGGEQRISG
jgi:hypothetical protein